MLSWLYRIIRWALALIFLYSGSAKILEPQYFAVIIDAYGLVPECMVIPIAVSLSFLEIVTGLGLLLDIRGTLAIATCLIVIFMAVLGYGIHMGLDIDCGCFGPADTEAKAFHGLRFTLCRDAVMILGIFYLYGWRIKRSIRLLSIKKLFENILKQKGVFQNANN